jgi:trans-AT polyketide synthase/acyltransferase/oxidoreductase domain-containing protein
MGVDIFGKFPNEVAIADGIMGLSVERLCTEDPEDQLGQTQFAQPAIFLVSALAYLERLAEGSPPELVAGHSLGEYSALFAAGAFDLATGLRLVKKRGELMGRVSGGAMAAVVGLDLSRVETLMARPECKGLDIANINSPSQIVLSGPVDCIDAVGPLFLSEGVGLYKRLKVSAPFHSRAMGEAARAFRRFIDPVEFEPLGIEVVANVTAQPYGAGSIHDLLSSQIDSTVQWSRSVKLMLGRPDPEFSEIGHGRVLTGLIRQCRRQFS